MELRTRTSPLVAFLAIAGVVLTGCAGRESVKTLDRPASAEDELPAGIETRLPIDRGSLRLDGEADEAMYYLAREEGRGNYCLLVVTVGAEEVGGACGGLPLLLKLQGLPDTQVIPDGFSAPPDWHMVGNNVIVANAG